MYVPKIKSVDQIGCAGHEEFTSHVCEKGILSYARHAGHAGYARYGIFSIYVSLAVSSSLSLSFFLSYFSPRRLFFMHNFDSGLWGPHSPSLFLLISSQWKISEL